MRIFFYNDGSKFLANNSKGRHFAKNKLDDRINS